MTDKSGAKATIMVEAQPLLRSKSGIGWYTEHLIKGVLKSDYKLIGAYHDFLGRNDSASVMKAVGIEAMKANRFLPTKIYKLLWNILPIPFDRIFGKADLYHFFNYLVPPIKHGKVITTVHDLAYIFYPETLDKRNLFLFKRNMERSLNRADLIVTVSEATKKDMMEQLGTPENRIRIVPCAIDYKTFEVGQNLDNHTIATIRTKYSLPEKYLLFLGTIEPRKNIDGIFKAYATLSKEVRQSVKLVVAGGKGWGNEALLKLPEELGIENDIVYTGYIDEEDKPYLYGMSEMFLFPSLYEGFGIPILEAMASGTPVITSDNSSMPEVGGEAAVYVKPLETETITDAIKQLLDQPSLREEKIEKGIRHARTFSWQASVEKLMAVYEELLDHEV